MYAPFVTRNVPTVVQFLSKSC